MITNAFNLMFVLCLHKHRILEESISTSTHELSSLSAVSENSFFFFRFEFVENVLC